MSRLRIVLAAVFAVACVAVLAVPASASTPAASNAKFCTAVPQDRQHGNGSQPTKTQAKTLAKQFKTAAKYAPAKVKSAMNNITKYLGVSPR